MGWYLHAIPADGGLFVPAKNLQALIKGINGLYEDEPDKNLILNPRNPVEALKIQEIFPREIIETFHAHATKGGLMVMSDYNDDTLYLAGHPTEFVRYSDSMKINDTVEVKEFIEEHIRGTGASVMTMQEIPPNGAPDDNSPAVVCKNGSMREIRDFSAACARRATQGMGDPRFSVSYDYSNSFTMQETKEIIQRESSGLRKN